MVAPVTSVAVGTIPITDPDPTEYSQVGRAQDAPDVHRTEPRNSRATLALLPDLQDWTGEGCLNWRTWVALANDVGHVLCPTYGLASQGKELDIKTVRTLSRRLAQRARQAYEAGHWPVGETLAGRRVVLSLEGGRVRIRTPKRGRKTAKRQHRYTTDWQEPKLLVIYVVDQEGRADRRECPWLDGTLQGPEALFALIRYDLSRLGVGQADTRVVIADGTRWLWKRVAELVAHGSVLELDIV